MSTGWTREQWKQYHAIVEISHKLAHQGAKKALQDAGLWPVSYGAFVNIEDRIGEGIRRGAIEVLSLQAEGKEKWEKRDFEW